MKKMWGYAAALVVVAVAAVATIVHMQTPHSYRDLVPILFARAWHALLFAALWFAAYLVGRACLKLARFRESPPPELSAAAGVVVFVVLATVASALHVAYALVIKITTAAALLAAAWGWVRELKEAPARIRRWFAELELGPAVFVVFAGMLTVPLLLAAIEPPIYWDALTYHLAVPKAYVRAHGFVYLPYNVYASMPLGGTMFYLWAALWDGFICANASYFVTSLLAVALTYRLARTWLPQFYAAVAAFLVLFTPVFYIVMPGAHVDHFLLLFASGALYVYFREGGGDAPRRVYVAAGVFLGAAVAVKYTSVCVLAGLAPVLTYDLIKRKVKVADVAVLLGVAFVLVAPWLVKAYVERGNPVFPLFYEYLGGRDFSADQARRLVEWQGGMGKGRGVVDYLLLPYRISIKADFDYPSFAGVYLPYLVPLAIAGAALFRKNGRLAAYAGGFAACWALGPQQLRFLSGTLGAFGILAASALYRADGAWGPRLQRLWRTLVVAFVVFTGLSFNVGGVINTMEGFEYMAGRDAETFLIEKCGFYMAQKQINERTPAHAKILMVFTNHTLYLEREAIYDSFFEASAFLMAAERGADADGLYQLCRRWGVDYVHIFRLFEKIAWQSYSPRTKQVFNEFIDKYGVKVYTDPLNDVYELYPPTD